jgi:hypothetical protein
MASRKKTVSKKKTAHPRPQKVKVVGDDETREADEFFREVAKDVGLDGPPDRGSGMAAMQAAGPTIGQARAINDSLKHARKFDGSGNRVVLDTPIDEGAEITVHRAGELEDDPDAIHVTASASGRTTAEPPLPMWKSHKVVRAAKVVDITLDHPDQGDDEYLVLENGAQVELSGDLAERLLVGGKIASELIGGYFIRYDDGYESWSPARSFESGYTPYEGLPVDREILHGQTRPMQLGYAAVSLTAGGDPQFPGWIKTFAIMPRMGNGGPRADLLDRLRMSGGWRGYAIVTNYSGRPMFVPIEEVFGESELASATPEG